MGEDQHYTTEQYAQLTGTPVSSLRRQLRAGTVQGAYRLDGDRGPWRIAVPRNDSTPRAQLGARGVSAEPSTDRLAADLMSTHRPSGARHVELAMQAGAALAQVTTRPARAAAAMLPALVAVASRHTADRDGWCVACSWQAPCVDQLAATAALEAVQLIVLDGAA